MSIPVPQIFVETLIEAGIDHVFGIPGGCTPALFDGLAGASGKIRTVLARHEGGAAVMADAYARVTGKPAVLAGQGAWIATSGGYGIIESLSSGIPVVIVCDLSDYQNLPLHGPYQNGSGDYGSFDVPAMLKAMTKFTTVAGNTDEFVHGLRLAIKHAVTGRPGPAALAVKWSVPFQAVDPDSVHPRLWQLKRQVSPHLPSIGAAEAETLADILIKAKRPVMVLGQGARWSGAGSEALKIAELLGIPIATTFLGKSAVPETHPAAIGVMGTLGQAYANRCITEADVLLAVGTGLAPDNTKWLNPGYIDGERQRIIHIDIEPRNIGWNYPADPGIIADAKAALTTILAVLEKRDIRRPDGLDRLAADKQAGGSFSRAGFDDPSSPLAPERVVAEVENILGEEDYLVIDGGNNRMWFTHHFRSKRIGQVVAGGGVAAIGYAPSAALAVQTACPDNRVLAVMGDGGLLMACYALESARDLKLPVTFLVMNNSMLGNVNDYQRPGRKIATEYSRPEFAAMAEGLGIRAVRIDRAEDLAGALAEAHGSDEPWLLDVSVRPDPHFKLMDQPPFQAETPSEG